MKGFKRQLKDSQKATIKGARDPKLRAPFHSSFKVNIHIAFNSLQLSQHCKKNSIKCHRLHGGVYSSASSSTSFSSPGNWGRPGMRKMSQTLPSWSGVAKIILAVQEAEQKCCSCHNAIVTSEEELKQSSKATKEHTIPTCHWHN